MDNLMRDTCDALARSLTEKTDELILSALNKRFGMNLTAESLCALEGPKLHCVKWYNQTIDGYVETYKFDGVPFFDLYPIETRMDGFTLITERKYRNLK